MSRKAIIPLVLGLGIGLLAVKFIVASIQKAQAANASRQVVHALRAKQDIAAYEQITKEMVESIETVDNLFAPQHDRLEKVEAAIGRVAAKPIPKNAPVLLSMLAPEGTAPGMVGRIPAGFRAVSVKIDEAASAGYHIKPGDWVDVIVVMDVDTGSKRKKDTIAEVILQHVQVAAIGQGTNPDSEQTGGPKAKPAKSATLMVPEEEVPKLHLAGSRGKLTLAMRGEDDLVIETPAKAIGSEIMKGMGAMMADATPSSPSGATLLTNVPPAPAEVEQEPHNIMVFHGTVGNQPMQVEQITFENPRSTKILFMSSGGPSRALGTMAGAPKSGAFPGQPSSKEPPATTGESVEPDDEVAAPDAGE